MLYHRWQSPSIHAAKVKANMPSSHPLLSYKDTNPNGQITKQLGGTSPGKGHGCSQQHAKPWWHYLMQKMHAQWGKATPVMCHIRLHLKLTKTFMFTRHTHETCPLAFNVPFVI